MTVRMPVTELLRMPSRDAEPHRHDGHECYCAESVVKGILTGGRCSSCRSYDCRLYELVQAYERDGDFVRPVHVNFGTVLDGHHRLAVASWAGAEDLRVLDAPREDRRVNTVIEAEWLRSEIIEIARELSWCGPWELREELQRQLDIDLSEGAGAELVMKIAQSALKA